MILNWSQNFLKALLNTHPRILPMPAFCHDIPVCSRQPAMRKGGLKFESGTKHMNCMADACEVEKLDAYQFCETITSVLLKAHDDLARYRSQVYNLEALLINCEPQKQKNVLQTISRDDKKDKLFLMQKLQSVLNVQLILQQQVKVLQEQVGQAPPTGETRAKLRHRSKAVVNQVSDMQAQMRTLQGQIAGLAAQKGFTANSGDREEPHVGSNNNNSERRQEEANMTGPVAENFRSLTKQIRQLRAAAETYLERTAPSDRSGNTNNAYDSARAAIRHQGPGSITMATNRPMNHGFGLPAALNRNSVTQTKRGCCVPKYQMPYDGSCLSLSGDARAMSQTHRAKAICLKKVSTKRSQTCWSALTTRTVASQSELIGSEVAQVQHFRARGTQADFQTPARNNCRVQTEPPPLTTTAVQSQAPVRRSRGVQTGGRNCTHCGAMQEARSYRRRSLERCCPSEEDEWN